jgi:hypothetical protein
MRIGRRVCRRRFSKKKTDFRIRRGCSRCSPSSSGGAPHGSARSQVGLAGFRCGTMGQGFEGQEGPFRAFSTVRATGLRFQFVLYAKAYQLQRPQPLHGSSLTQISKHVVVTENDVSLYYLDEQIGAADQVRHLTGHNHRYGHLDESGFVFGRGHRLATFRRKAIEARSGSAHSRNVRAGNPSGAEEACASRFFGAGWTAKGHMREVFPGLRGGGAALICSGRRVSPAAWECALGRLRLS